MAGAGRRTHDERGASAVEFALVAPVLVLLLMGLLQYGLYVRDALDTRQAVREAVRFGATAEFGSCGEATDGDDLRCLAHELIAASSDSSWVMVVAPDGWERGAPLLVCAMVEADGGFGFVPMPDGGMVSARTQMSIEVDPGTDPSGFPTADAAPAGRGWEWCA